MDLETWSQSSSSKHKVLHMEEEDIQFPPGFRAGVFCWKRITFWHSFSQVSARMIFSPTSNRRQEIGRGKTTDQPSGVQSFVKRFLDTLETVGPALRPCGFSVSNFHNLFHSAVGRAPGTIINPPFGRRAHGKG